MVLIGLSVRRPIPARIKSQRPVENQKAEFWPSTESHCRIGLQMGQNGQKPLFDSKTAADFTSGQG